MKTYPRVLTIAGSDSGGGAGIQADIKSISATGGYAASAITAITVQNTIGVSAVHAVPVEILGGQIDAVLSDIGADAVKIGMLHSEEVIMCVKQKLIDHGVKNIVLDPVMVATSGHKLIEDEAIAVLIRELVPIARVITPNIPEAEIMAGKKIRSQADLPAIARKLSCGGKVSVLMKAGHLTEEDLTDIFYNAEKDTCIELHSRRIHSANTHGTGCTLSSAIASNLALGHDMPESIRLAKEYISNALAAMLDLGAGSGPMNHAFMIEAK